MNDEDVEPLSIYLSGFLLQKIEGRCHHFGRWRNRRIQKTNCQRTETNQLNVNLIQTEK